MDSEWFECFPGLTVHRGAGNTGVLRSGASALLVDAADAAVVPALRAAGVQRVEQVLLTDHRRMRTRGLDALLGAFHPRIGASAEIETLLRAPESYWQDPKSRWYLLMGHVPYHDAPVQPIPLDFTVQDDTEIHWHEWRIHGIATPGYADGAVSYLVENGAGRAGFIGGLMAGPGVVPDLYSLQRSHERNGCRLGDYHGYLGGMESVLAGLDRVLANAPNVLIPAWGEPIRRPQAGVALLRRRFDDLYANYVSTSALRWYFPKYFEAFAGRPENLPRQLTAPPPEDVRRVEAQAWLLLAADGHALFLDPCSESAVHAVSEMRERGEIAAVDGIWITHYHCDHIEGAELARRVFKCPVVTDRHVAEIITHPDRHFLTCLSPHSVQVDRATRDGETWSWRNFRLTAHHLPGQTLYHAGLLADRNDGIRYFFVGDSFTPTGIDDYCTWNRNFLETAPGLPEAVALARKLAPDWMFNPHVEVGFRFSDAAWAHLASSLAARAERIRALTPWESADFATDEAWVHAVPYEQALAPGRPAAVAVCVLNHADSPQPVTAWLETPSGWDCEPPVRSSHAEPHQEVRLRFRLQAPRGTPAGLRVLPVGIRFGDRDLGGFREVRLQVTGEDAGQGRKRA